MAENSLSGPVSLMGLAVSIFALYYADSQVKIAEAEVATLREQLQQVEKHHEEELRLRRKPFVAFAADSLFYIEKSKDGSYWFQQNENGTWKNASSLPRIKNFGNGPALDMQIKWLPQAGTPNEASTMTRHLFPDDETTVLSFPSAMIDSPSGRCEGDVWIKVRDLEGTHHEMIQSFVATRNSADGRTHILFTKLKSLPSDWKVSW